MGGAQAIGAMAYGTESIEAVDVIVGPGNRYVAEAKRQVSGVVGVASAFAGPSEVVVIAGPETPPELAAIDLVVQAEHGPDGLAWLLTWSEEVAEAVVAHVARMVEASPRRADLEATLDAGGFVVLVDDLEQACAVANVVAPEHLGDPDRRGQVGAARSSRPPGPSSSAPTRRPASATIWPDPTTCCPPTGRPGSPVPSGWTTSGDTSTPSPSARRPSRSSAPTW